MKSNFNKSLYAPTAILCAIGIYSYLRLYFKVDFGEYSHFISLMMRFDLGDKPFIDEVNVCQITALIHLPFYWIHKFLFSNTVFGIHLFMNHVQWMTTLITAASVYLLTRRIVADMFGDTKENRAMGIPCALLAAAMTLAWLPHMLMANNHFTTGFRFVEIGNILLIFWGLGSHRSTILLLIAAGLHCLGVLAYPPVMLSPILTFAAVILIFRPKIKPGLIYVTACLCTASAFLFLLHSVDFFATAQPHIDAYHEGEASAPFLLKIKNLITSGMPNRYLLLTSFIVAAALIKLYRRTLLVISITLLIFILSAPATHVPSNAMLFAASVFLPLTYFFVRTDRKTQWGKLLLLIWLPGIISNLTIISTSAAGFYMLGGGMGLSLLLITLFPFVFARQSTYELSLTFLIALLFIAKFMFYDFPKPPWAFHSTGPYAGLFMNPKGDKALSYYEDVVKNASPSPGQIFIYPPQSADFLLWNRVPNSPDIYPPTGHTRRTALILQHFLSTQDKVSVVIIKTNKHFPDPRDQEEVQQALKKFPNHIKLNENKDIYYR